MLTAVWLSVFVIVLWIDCEFIPFVKPDDTNRSLSEGIS